MMAPFASETALLAAGFAAGGCLGLAARMGRFCSLGAIEDALYGDSFDRLRLWAAAAASAILLTAIAAAAGWADPFASFYAAAPWSPVSTLLGGLLFGYGMALTGTCAFGALARIGGGDLRALVMALAIGLSAYMALGGLTAVPRAALAAATTIPNASLATLIGDGLGVAPFLVSVAAAAALGLWATAAPGVRARPRRLGWAIAVGAAIAGGWIATSQAAATGFGGVEPHSLTYVAPLGDALIYAMTSTGSRLDFGIASVVGVIAGAAAGSAWRGEIRWEACDDARELRRQLLGAFLMGTGGVMALGCTVGQGLTALSVLAPSAVLAIGAMGLGAVLGLRMLVEGRLTA